VDLFVKRKKLLMISKIESNKNAYFPHLFEKTKYNNGSKLKF
jgi:hypothetical protein